MHDQSRSYHPPLSSSSDLKSGYQSFFLNAPLSNITFFPFFSYNQISVILRRTPRRPTHIQQDVQHIHATHIRAHGRLINLRTPLVQQRIQG